MSSRKISPGEERYVGKVLEGLGGPVGDDAVWMDWVLKKKREKIQDRLLVVSRYRIVSIKRNKMGKKTTQREGHLYTLRKVSVDKDFNRCVLKFPEFHIEFSSPKIQEVIDAIRESFQKISFEWPESAYFQINAPEGCIKDLEEQERAPAEGLLAIYNAYCNFYSQPPSPDFKRFVEDTFQSGSSEFNISKCPGIEPKTEYTFDLAPALAMFSHCRHFRSFKLKNVARREAVGVFANALALNQTITRIVFSGLDAGPEGFIAMGDAFKKNPGNKVCELDLSDNKMGERGIAGLSSGLMTIQHGLTIFNVGKNGITPKGITSLISSLRANSQVSGTIVELDLSQNKFEAVASQTFADWVTDLKETATIANLNLSDTSIDVPTVLTGVRLGLIDSLTNLDLSNNKIDKAGAQSVALLLESSRRLQYLNVSYCKIAPEGIESLLNALKGNESLSDVKLDFSGNDLGVSGADKVSSGCEGNEKLHTVILQDNGLKVEGMKKILGTLMENSSLRCLDLSCNLRGATNTKPLTEQLCQLLKRHPSLETLLLVGDGKSAYGKDIVDLFNGINESRSLTELDVSNNKFGDRVATEIAEALRKNSSLTYLAWDNNGVNIGGYQAFRSCLTTSNKTLLEVPHPRVDVEKAVSGSKDGARFRERINELFNEINAALKSNRDAKGLKDRDNLPTNIFARQKEEFKEPPERPPVSAAHNRQSSRISTLRNRDTDSPRGSTVRNSPRTKDSRKLNSSSSSDTKKKKRDKEKEKEQDSDTDSTSEDETNPDEAASKVEEESPREERKRVAPPPTLGLPPGMALSDGVAVLKPGTLGRTAPPVFTASVNNKPASLRGAPPVFQPPAGRGRGSGFNGSMSTNNIKPPVFGAPPVTPPPAVGIPPYTPPPATDPTDAPPPEEDEGPPPPPPPRDDVEDEELYNYG